MPITIKKMQMNIGQMKNHVGVSAPAAKNIVSMKKNGSGLYTPMVTRISGAKSGCGCGK